MTMIDKMCENANLKYSRPLVTSQFWSLTCKFLARNTTALYSVQEICTRKKPSGEGIYIGV